MYSNKAKGDFTKQDAKLLNSVYDYYNRSLNPEIIAKRMRDLKSMTKGTCNR